MMALGKVALVWAPAVANRKLRADPDAGQNSRVRRLQREHLGVTREVGEATLANVSEDIIRIAKEQITVGHVAVRFHGVVTTQASSGQRAQTGLSAPQPVSQTFQLPYADFGIA